MKKLLSLLLSASLLFQSCYSTRYVPVEADLRNNYRNAIVDDIEFDFGQPNEVQNLRTGYAYIYYYDDAGRIYTRIAFDNDDRVRSISSNKKEKQRKFNAGDTVFTIIVFTVVIPALILVIASNARKE